MSMMSTTPPAVPRDLLDSAAAWPFQEARLLLEKRLKGKLPGKGYVLFETGYGPSGLPHIGTFGEVVRTQMVQNAFRLVAPDMPTRLFCFSDDMDGLRKVPDNIPNKEMVAKHLGQPLTTIPDPFGTHPSFGEHNNARLRAFLDEFGFDYEFQSSTDWYRSGRFDKGLLRVLECYDDVINVVLPTLGEERRETYSPFLPIDEETGRVLQVPVIERNVDAGTIVYLREDGKKIETPVTGGRCKLQWKADWGMRWYVLGVDYEMSGKDLIPSVALATRICRILGSEPPQSFSYELFLDAQGQKISKSRGNGLSVEEWLEYANPESLALFMYQKPKTAKRLHFDVIPRAVDEYMAFVESYPGQDEKDRINNPAWHIHGGHLPEPGPSLSYSLLLNLVSVCGSDDPATLWHYISAYAPGVTPDTAPGLNVLVERAIAYYRDFVLPNKKFRAPTAEERAALEDLRATLAALSGPVAAEVAQSAVYETGKRHPGVGELKDWFQTLYQVLLGQDRGPRMGTFIALYGLPETIALIDKALADNAPA